MTSEFRSLSEAEIGQLQEQGCTCCDWTSVKVAQEFNPERVRLTHFSGDVEIGVLEKTVTFYGGLEKPASITGATIHNCKIGSNVYINNIRNYIANYIIGDNGLALEAMSAKAKSLGLAPHIITSQQIGDTAEVAQLRAEEVLKHRYPGYNILLIGGETTIKLPPNAGRGGRNQHYAAVSMLAMAGYPGQWIVASVGTDGSDFLPDVAGAIVDQGSLDTARAKGIDVKAYIERCDSNTLLESIGNSLIITGDTGTNVGDIMVYLVIERAS